MTSVLVAVRPDWLPVLQHVRRQVERYFVRDLIDELPFMVSNAMEKVEGSEDVAESSIAVDSVAFSDNAKNTPDIWIVVSITEDELYSPAKVQIREELQVEYGDFLAGRDIRPKRVWINVVVVNGTGVEVNQDGNEVGTL